MPHKKRNYWMRYTTLATEMMIVLGVAVFGGLKLDDWLHTKPLFIIVLPTLALIVLLIRLVKQLNANP